MLIDLDDPPMEYEIEKIEKRRIKRYTPPKPDRIWYLVKWLGHTDR